MVDPGFTRQGSQSQTAGKKIFWGGTFFLKIAQEWGGEYWTEQEAVVGVGGWGWDWGRGLSPLRHPKSTNERSEGPLLKQKYF